MGNKSEQVYVFPDLTGALQEEPQWTSDEGVLLEQAQTAHAVLVKLGMSEEEAQRKYEHDMGHCLADTARRHGALAAFGNSIIFGENDTPVEGTIVYCTPRGTRTEAELANISRGGMEVHEELTSSADRKYLKKD